MQEMAFIKKKDVNNALSRGYRINVIIRKIKGG
jgi:hypothetical protein